MNTTFDPKDTPLPVAYFGRKYNLSRVTLWRYRRAGLPSLGVGDKVFIIEEDFVEFLRRWDGQTVPANPNKEAKS